MTEKQLDHLRHALGLNDSKHSNRNYFATEPGCYHWDDIQALVSEGLMRPGRMIPGGLQYFHATEEGKKAAGIA